MRLPEPIPVKEIAREFNATLIGDETLHATGVNEIHKVTPGDITFSDVEKYFNKALKSEATIIILNKAAECPDGKALLICDNPFEVYDTLISRYRPFRPIGIQIDPTAEIHPDAVLEPNVIVGAHVKIGAGTRIEAGTVIRDYTEIGERVIIQSGVVIGSDAFYFKKAEGQYTKWTSGGRVIIEDDVYIGSNCTINRGVSGDTVIGAGSKIDCLVHIGHGAVLGRNCLIAAQVGISGKTILGDGCTLYGQVGVAHGLKISPGVTALAKSGVGESHEPGQTVFGIPATDARAKWREKAAIRKLPAIINQLEKLLEK